MTETCSTCRWWVVNERHSDRGSCRRYPPQVAIRSTPFHDEFTPSFPGTMAHVWCGEWASHQPKEGGHAD